MQLTPKFGQILGQFVPLSHHDIEEILHEQAVSRKRFGHIALAMGLCRPEHVWKAWRGQLNGVPRTIDLNEFGVDTQALQHIDAATARKFRVLPVRLLEDELVVATSESALAAAQISLAEIEPKHTFVLTSDGQISSAIELYYPDAIA
jgi:hypothetical protein